MTETCDPDNKLQLITKVQVAPNGTDDSQLLVEALPNLKERTDFQTIFTDGGQASSDTDTARQAQKVKQVQTAIPGRKPNPDKLHLADFILRFDPDSIPFEITCPQNQTVGANLTKQKAVKPVHWPTNAHLKQANVTPVDACASPRLRLKLLQDDGYAGKKNKLGVIYERHPKLPCAASSILSRPVNCLCQANSK